jgi:hypothetical protein
MTNLARSAVVFALTAASLGAQDWEPTQIEALTDYPRLAWIGQFIGDVAIRCTLDGSCSVVKAEVISEAPSLLVDAALKKCGPLEISSGY